VINLNKVIAPAIYFHYFRSTTLFLNCIFYKSKQVGIWFYQRQLAKVTSP